jgi:hypothetical protein
MKLDLFADCIANLSSANLAVHIESLSDGLSTSRGAMTELTRGGMRNPSSTWSKCCNG